MSRPWEVRAQAGPFLIGVVALVLLVFGLGVWSVSVNISGAIIVSGELVPKGGRLIVQHPKGGRIHEILVNEGEVVAAGDVMLSFDNSLLLSEYAVIAEQYLEILARKSRLEAERDGRSRPDFSDVQVEGVDAPVQLALIQGQQRLFDARSQSLAREEAVLHERESQILAQIAGALAQLEALATQKALVDAEIDDENQLMSMGLSKSTDIRLLMRDSARILGVTGEIEANMVELQALMAEAGIGVERLQMQFQADAVAILRDLSHREIELREQRAALAEEMQRLKVRAQVDGVVFDLRFHTAQAVVRPAEPLLQIAPLGVSLVVVAHVRPDRIREIHLHQEAGLLFRSADLRTTNPITGRISKIAPDVTTADHGGESFYVIEVDPDADSADEISRLLPGMPVEVLIKTGDQTPLQMLTDPLGRYFDRALRSR